MKIIEGLNLVSKKKYQDKIEGNYPGGDGTLIQYWDNGKTKVRHRTYSSGAWFKYTYDENGNQIYYEASDGYWEKWKYDENGYCIYFEQSNGYWNKHEYNENGNKIYYETSDGYWSKWEYNENGNRIYYEDSDGEIRDNRPQNINEGLNLVSKKKYREIIMGNYPDGEGQLIQYWDNGNIKKTHHTNRDGGYIIWEYNKLETPIKYSDEKHEVLFTTQQTINEGLNLIKPDRKKTVLAALEKICDYYKVKFEPEEKKIFDSDEMFILLKFTLPVTNNNSVFVRLLYRYKNPDFGNQIGIKIIKDIDNFVAESYTITENIETELVFKIDSMVFDLINPF